ncbi:hypothetical protein ANN_11770 [Periplaneta americana]|uniref:Uncharacterized protein n=1 Tax=Periplaneta americana TaxID=6978 RepID=A0ABQ8T5Z0_PERAM|nr:hypothetical protein ANN_11770 [Periplaneta americana]
MAGLCEGGNEPPGSLKVKRLKCWQLCTEPGNSAAMLCAGGGMNGTQTDYNSERGRSCIKVEIGIRTPSCLLRARSNVSHENESLRNWKAISQDRDNWRKIVEEAKVHNELKRQEKEEEEEEEEED